MSRGLSYLLLVVGMLSVLFYFSTSNNTNSPVIIESESVYAPKADGLARQSPFAAGSIDLHDSKNGPLAEQNSPTMVDHEFESDVIVHGQPIPRWVVDHVSDYTSRDSIMLSGEEIRMMIWNLGAESWMYGYYAVDQLNDEQLQMLGTYIAEQIRFLYVSSEAQEAFVDYLEEHFVLMIGPERETEEVKAIIQGFEEHADAFDHATLITMHEMMRLWPR